MRTDGKENEESRTSWDGYFLEIADAVSHRATCNRGRSGCVIVKDKRILVTGYVGSPSGMPHCDDAGHLFEENSINGQSSKHCIRTVHADQNAICQAAKNGISIEGTTLYTRMTPCRTCAMLLINCGIKRVVCERKYHRGSDSERLFEEVGIEIEYKYNEVQQY